MIKAIGLDGSTRALTPEITTQGDCTTLTLPKETDTSAVREICFEYLEDLARDGDEGYFLIPNEGMLCSFRGHQDEEFVSQKYAMPVFGVKTRRQSYLAVVAGMAYGYELVCGVRDGKYYIYPRFRLDGAPLAEAIVIHYFRLSEADADYSGMARRYRRYQLERGEIRPLQERMRERETLDYAANSVMVRVRLGWKPVPPEILHQTPENEPEMHVACTFARVGEILDECRRQGVEKAEFCLVGWNCKGHDGRYPQVFPVEEALGGEEELRRLIDKAHALGYQITCHTNSTDAYEIAENWSVDDLTRTPTGEIVDDPNRWSAGQMYWLCPTVALRQAQEIYPKLADFGFRGLHYIDVLSIVMPRLCSHPDHPLNVVESIETSRRLMAYASETFGGYSSEGGYDFGAKYLDYALNTDYYGTYQLNPLCDEKVPFWQLVYHGVILSNPNMYETLNFPARDEPTGKLRLLEYGGRPSFYFYWNFRGDWRTAAKNDLVCDTQEQLERSVSQLREGQELNKILAPLQTAYFDRHEKLAPGVYRSTFSDGTVITVDYNRAAYTIDRR